MIANCIMGTRKPQLHTKDHVEKAYSHAQQQSVTILTKTNCLVSFDQNSLVVFSVLNVGPVLENYFVWR